MGLPESILKSSSIEVNNVNEEEQGHHTAIADGHITDAWIQHSMRLMN